MKSTFKAGTLALISLVTAVVAINSSALAGDRISPNPPITTISTPMACTPEQNQEFRYLAVLKNITNQAIPSGKVIYFRAYHNGKAQGTQLKYTLTQPLAPGQGIRPGVNIFSAGNSANYTCKAYY